jgi:uncharacterized membrane protein
MNTNRKNISLFLMSALYILAGFNHFMMTAFYLKIMPPYIPNPLLVVYLSGLGEIVLGASLLNKKTREAAAWGIILLLIVVFPANVFQFTSGQMPLLAFVFRTIVQLLLIFWSYSHVNDDIKISA